jgi:hypothetical protein
MVESTDNDCCAVNPAASARLVAACRRTAVNIAA